MLVTKGDSLVLNTSFHFNSSTVRCRAVLTLQERTATYKIHNIVMSYVYANLQYICFPFCPSIWGYFLL